jgi:hypothetical protein
LVGLVTGFILVGIPLIIIGLIMIVRGLTTGPALAIPSTPPLVTQREIMQKETITREVVKVPCKYCGTLNIIATDRFCSGCGAPVK